MNVMVVYMQVDSGSLIEPLWDASTVPYPYPNNMMFVRDYTIKLLGTSFPNMTVAEVVYPTFSAHFPWPSKHFFLSLAQVNTKVYLRLLNLWMGFSSREMTFRLLRTTYGIFSFNQRSSRLR